MKSQMTRKSSFEAQKTLVVCPNCGQYTPQLEITFQRGSRGNNWRFSNWIAPFIKAPPTTGQICESCRHMFNVSRSRMPVFYYAWLALLSSIAIASAILLYLLLVGP